MTRNYLLLALVAASLVACGRAPDAQNQDAAQAPAAAGQAAPQAQNPAPAQPSAPAQSGIWTVPAELKECARPQSVEVDWDARSFADVAAVDIVAVNKEGKESLFLTAGRAGKRETGTWMKAGAQLILRDKGTQKELGRTIIGSIPCD